MRASRAWFVLCLIACTKPRHAPPPPPAVAPSAPAPDAAPTTPVVEESLVELAGTKLFVRVSRLARSAPTTIIVLHGGPGLSHEYMRPFESLVSPTTTVAMFDQRGTGRSEMPADRTALAFADFADDVEALRVKLGAERVDLIGHSYGGPIAMAYAIAHPTRTRSLILVDTMPPKFGDYMAGQWYFREAMGEARHAGHIPAKLPEVEGDDCEKQLVALLPVYFHDKQHPMTKHLAGSSCHEAVGNATREANQHYNLHDGLMKLPIPTLVIHGASDPFRQQMADTTVAALQSAQPTLHVIEACGHVPFEECPDRFWPLVRSFLAARP